jgi:hypothetical protein
VARRLEWTHAKGVQNHMQRHWTPPPPPGQEADEDLDALIEDTMAQLREEARYASVNVKPFYLTAIHNLKGLRGTNASQQHLTAALKAIHEVTGMKMEQQLMLDFARHHFNQVGPAAKAAVEQHTSVIDVDEVGG